MTPSISINWSQRVNIGSSKGLVSINKKPLTKPTISQSPMSRDTSNATKFTWQQHKAHIGLIPRHLRSWIHHEITFDQRQHRKSFWQPGKYMWQLSMNMKRSRARMCAVYGEKQRIWWEFCNNSYYWQTWHKLTDYRLLLLQETAKRWLLMGKNIIAQRVWPRKMRKSLELWSTRYEVLIITAKSLYDHRKHGTDRTFRWTTFTLRPLTDLQSVKYINKCNSQSPQLTQNTKVQNLVNTKQHIKLDGTNTCYSLLITLKDYH